MKISVALATFNGERFLEEQLRSLAEQTQLPDELIVGDDCSTDSTLRILRDFAHAAPFPVQILANKENLGFQRNFARTVLRCSGDIIFFCDQDDIWYPNKIAVCCDTFKCCDRPQIVSHDAYLADRSNTHGGLTLGAQFEASGGDRGSNMVYGCCLAFSRFFADFFHADLAHSHDCWLVEIGQLLGARHHLDVPLISYRRHGGNVTSSHQTSLARSSKFRSIHERIQFARVIDIAAEVENSLLYLTDLHISIKNRSSEVIEYFGRARLFYAIADLERRIGQLKLRRAMYVLPRRRRFTKMARLRMSGQYNGVTALGFIRDLLQKPRLTIAPPKPC